MLGCPYWAGGEIGRRTALRTRRRKAWRFESSPAHKTKEDGVLLLSAEINPWRDAANATCVRCRSWIYPE
jgi:hypothetical protein